MDKFKLKLILYPGKDNGSIGPGIIKLLEGINATGSLNKASSNLDMAYSKAWKIIGRSEKNLGFNLIERLPGAKGSKLTENGRLILEYYHKAELASKKVCEEILLELNLKKDDSL